MNLKVLMLLLLYYIVISLTFILAGGFFNGYSTNVNLNSTELQSQEIDSGGLFNTGVDFGRFIAFVGFGIIPADNVPFVLQLILSLWQSLLTIFTVGFVISGIWNG